MVFLGIFLLVETFFPEFYSFMLPYAHVIRSIFWGVVLLFVGLYLIFENKKWRTLVAIVFVLYLALYLAVLKDPSFLFFRVFMIG